jgi:hypothetical protein
VRAWLIAIARRVHARHLQSTTADAGLIDQLGGQLVLAQDVAARLDARRDGEELLQRAGHLSGCAETDLRGASALERPISRPAAAPR